MKFLNLNNILYAFYNNLDGLDLLPQTDWFMNNNLAILFFTISISLFLTIILF